MCGFFAKTCICGIFVLTKVVRVFLCSSAFVDVAHIAFRMLGFEILQLFTFTVEIIVFADTDNILCRHNQ